MQCQKRQEELRKTAESFMNNHFSDSSFQDSKVLYRTVAASGHFPRYMLCTGVQRGFYVGPLGPKYLQAETWLR